MFRVCHGAHLFQRKIASAIEEVCRDQIIPIMFSFGDYALLSQASLPTGSFVLSQDTPLGNTCGAIFMSPRELYLSITVSNSDCAGAKLLSNTSRNSRNQDLVQHSNIIRIIEVSLRQPGEVREQQIFSFVN